MIRKFLMVLLFSGALVSQVPQAVADESHGTHEPPAESHAHEHDDHDAHDDHEDHDDHAEHGEEESTGGVGPNNAVTAADEARGIQLSEKAQRAIGIVTVAWNGTAIPKSALVQHQQHRSVYRLRDGWFTLISITVMASAPDQLMIQSAGLQSGDAVVTNGAGLLRVAELDAFSTEVGHSH